MVCSEHANTFSPVLIAEEKERDFEVASFKGRKALVLATDNFIGGRNFGIGILFLVGSVLSFAFVIGILVVMRVCPE